MVSHNPDMITLAVDEGAAEGLDGLLDRVGRGQSVTLTRGGRPLARLTPADPPVPDAAAGVPDEASRERARAAAARIRERRKHVKRQPIEKIVALVREDRD